MSDSSTADGRDATAASAAVPPAPLLPPPATVTRLLETLPASPARDAAADAAARLWAALAARWARDRRALAIAGPRDDAERGAVSIFRMIDSGWRFADEPEAVRGLRRTLMPDGVGAEVYRDWPDVLAWMRAVAAALEAPGAAAARTRHLEWMVQRYVEEVEAARQASVVVPAGSDVPAAALALARALEDAVTRWIEAGGDVDALVAEDGAGRVPVHGGAPVEPAAGRAPADGAVTAEVEEADD